MSLKQSQKDLLSRIRVKKGTNCWIYQGNSHKNTAFRQLKEIVNYPKNEENLCKNSENCINPFHTVKESLKEAKNDQLSW